MTRVPTAAVSPSTFCVVAGRDDKSHSADRPVVPSRWHLESVKAGEMAGVTGLEPATSGVTGQRSNRTELHPRMGSDDVRVSAVEVKLLAGRARFGGGRWCRDRTSPNIYACGLV